MAVPGARTHVRTHTTFPSLAHRDTELEHMHSGMFESYDRLTALLAQDSEDACELR